MKQKSVLRRWDSVGATIRLMKKSDFSFVRRGLSETNWQDIPDDQKEVLNKKDCATRIFHDFERYSKDKRFKFVVFVAESDNEERLGYVSVGELVNPTVGLKLGAVLDFWVEPHHRKEGVGSRLLDYALDYLRSRRYSHASIMVSAQNELALRMYKKRGFRADRIILAKKLK